MSPYSLLLFFFTSPLMFQLTKWPSPPKVCELLGPQGQHCPKIMMPPHLTTTNSGTYISSLARLGSQSRYSTS